MAGKQVDGDGMHPSLAGMSKNQLYGIMSQMKSLVEQNQQQARQILIQNPVLTRALFQAQILLGMVQPPQTISNPLPPPPPISNRQTNIDPRKTSATPNQPTSSFPSQTSQNQMRKQQQSNQASYQKPNQATMVSNPHHQPIPPNPQPQPTISHGLLQPVKQPNAQLPQMSTSQSSQVPNITHLPQHSVSQTPPSLHQPSLPLPTQSQQQIQASGNNYASLQQSLPPQSRPPMSGFPNQGHAQMGPNMDIQQASGPQMQHSQNMFHQGQMLHHNQPTASPLYQGGNTIGQLPGQPSFPSQVGPSNQNPRPALLAPDLEKQLLQQVMSLTPEQINQLPPEHRNQVLQLQQVLRQ